MDAVALDAVAATARSVLRLATSPELPSFCPATTLRCLADLDAEVDAVSGGGGSAERRASWVGVFDLSGDEGGATASDSDDGDRPPLTCWTWGPPWTRPWRGGGGGGGEEREREKALTKKKRCIIFKNCKH